MRYLYRYSSLSDRGLENSQRFENAERLFTTSELLFSSSANFNDPFDSSLSPTLLEGTDEEYTKYFINIFRKMRPSAPIPEIEVEVRGIIESGRHRDKNIRDSVMENAQKIIHSAGVLSLSRTARHPLMWSHYADSHRGFCVQFAHSNEPFFGGALPVAYADKIPCISHIRDTSRTQTVVNLLTKASFWSYEREWRIIQHEGGPGFYAFEPRLLTGVIFGLRTSSKDREQIVGWLQKHKSQPQLFEARKDRFRYWIRLSKIK